MKKALIALFMLIGCDNTPDTTCNYDSGNWKVNQQLRAELFDKCLARVGEARKGESYTATFSEDYYKVINECGDQASNMSRYCIYEKK